MEENGTAAALTVITTMEAKIIQPKYDVPPPNEDNLLLYQQIKEQSKQNNTLKRILAEELEMKTQTSLENVQLKRHLAVLGEENMRMEVSINGLRQDVAGLLGRLAVSEEELKKTKEKIQDNELMAPIPSRDIVPTPTTLGSVTYRGTIHTFFVSLVHQFCFHLQKSALPIGKAVVLL